MPTYFSTPERTRDTPPQGTFLARVYRYVHIGTVDDVYDGKPIRPNRIQLAFELPTKTKVYREGELAKPISHYERLTGSMGEKANLRKIIEGIIGTTLTDKEAKSFDVESIVGMPCLLTLKHKTSEKGNIYAKIGAVTPLMEGQECPSQINPSVILTYKNWNQSIFDALPQFLQDEMKSSDEYKAKFEPGSTLSDQEKAILENRVLGDESSTPSTDDINPANIPF